MAAGLEGQLRAHCGRGNDCRGGLARRATCIDSLRRADPELILLDAGGFLADNDTIQRPADLAIWNEMQRLRYDAVVLGDNELRQLALLDPLLADSTAPTVCTNVERFRDGQWQPLGRRSRVVTAHGIRVGILSAVVEDSVLAAALERALRANPGLPDYRFDSDGIQVRCLPVVEACREEARRLRGSAEVIVLLGDLPRDLIASVAREVPEIDLIVGGIGARPLEAGAKAWASREPARINQTIVHTSPAGGREVAVTRLAVSADGAIVELRGGGVSLDLGMPEDPVVAQIADRVSSRVEEATLAREEE